MSFYTAGCGNKNGGQCDLAYGKVNELGGPVIPGTNVIIKQVT